MAPAAHQSQEFEIIEGRLLRLSRWSTLALFSGVGSSIFASVFLGFWLYGMFIELNTPEPWPPFYAISNPALWSGLLFLTFAVMGFSQHSLGKLIGRYIELAPIHFAHTDPQPDGHA